MRPAGTFGRMRERAVSTFLTTSLVALAVPAGFGIGWSRLELHQAVNTWHSGWADAFFPLFTNGADGWVPTILALLLLAYNWRSFLMLACSAGFSAIVVQALKHFVFPHVDRPMASLEVMPGLHVVQDIELHRFNSFPSGHSTCAFSMCFALAVIIGRQGWAVGSALLAAALAYSRVYLSQHFVQDAVAGSAIGILTAWCVHYWLYRSSFATRAWLDKRPVRFSGADQKEIRRAP